MHAMLAHIVTNLQAQLRAAIIGMHAGVFQLGVLQINGYIHAMHE